MEENKENKIKEISLRDLQKILVRCWWIMLAVAVLFASTTYLFLRITHKEMFTAKAKIWVMRETTGFQSNNKDTIKSTADVAIANNILEDVAETAKNNCDVREAVRAETGLYIGSSILRVSYTEKNHIVEISVTSEKPEDAYKLAESLMKQTCIKINALMGDESDYVKPYDSVEGPSPSNSISNRTVLLAGFVGAAVVYVVFLILHLLNDKIDSADDVETMLGISVLGEIPNERDVSTHKKRYGYYYRRYKAYRGQEGSEQ